MSFPQAIGSGFGRYVDFSGRSSRSEYWWWVLFVSIGAIVGLILDNLIGTSPILYVLFELAVVLPGLAVSVRRCHDIDKSGWWILIGIIPIVGGIILLIWFVRRGDHDENRYGPDPLQVSIP